MDEPLTLTFEAFWSWLLGHPNCILRAGTPEAVVYDDEDLHWHFASEGPQTLVVQMMRGKRLVGELLVEPEHVTYVVGAAGEREDEYLFELVSEGAGDRTASYFFVLSHGYDVEEEEEPSHPHSRVH
jgi:hypothetical protein